MANKFTEDVVTKLINMCELGNTYVEMSNEVNINADTISKYLRSHGYQRKTIHSLSQDDVDIIAKLYLNSNWDEIYSLYPFLNRQRVYTLMSNNHISKDEYFWSKDETEYLKENFQIISLDDLYNYYNGRHSRKAIESKAIKLGLTCSRAWSVEEDRILKEYYSKRPINEVMQMLQKRTYDSIIMHARILGIKSYYYLQEKYTHEEKQFIIDNFGKLTDQEIGEILGKTAHGIRDQRYTLGLLYLNKDYTGYENLPKLFRGQIGNWKAESMRVCNNQCVFTGSKDFKIHHIVSFNTIFYQTLEILNKENKLKSDVIEDYNTDELNYMIQTFQTVHSQYPLGVCIRSDIHNLFHKIYGAGGNTQDQWDIFVNNYKNHMFDECYYV